MIAGYQIDSFFFRLTPSTYHRTCYDYGEVGEEAHEIQEWMREVLHKIFNYHYLTETTEALQLALPRDIVINNVLPFLELPYEVEEGWAYMRMEDEMEEQSESDSVYNEQMEEEEYDNDNARRISIASSIYAQNYCLLAIAMLG